MSLTNARLSEYNRNAILSATPAQLLTMLYDRLLLDLTRARVAQEAENWPVASEQLVHAQAIIAELQSSLRVDIWDGGEGLFALYTYVNTALINANVSRNVSLIVESLTLLEPLRDAWYEASIEAGSSASSDGWGVA